MNFERGWKTGIGARSVLAREVAKGKANFVLPARLGGGTAPCSPQTLRPERCGKGAVWDGKGRSAQQALHK